MLVNTELLGSPHLVYALAAIFVLWFSSLMLHRILLHPLAHTPGPKLAAATLLYQTWYSFIGGSRFYLKIDQLHVKYGPVLRIGPNEVHLSDPANFERIHYVGTRFTKDPAFYGAFANPDSTFTTPGNELHRLRRGALNNFFSRKKVLELESIVQEKTESLLALVQCAIDQGTEVDLHHGLRAISIDVITEYAFGRCYNLLESEDLGATRFKMIQQTGPSAWFFRQWPWLKPVLYSIPVSIIGAVSEPTRTVLQLRKLCHDQLVEVQAEVAKESTSKGESRPTIFSTLLDSEHKDIANNLEDEVYLVINAASDTTGNTMTTIARNVVENPAIYKKLVDELCSAFPDQDHALDYITLEKLPYLTMVIKEGLRVAVGVPGRLPRVVPQEGATFNGFTFPAGTVVSMSSWTLHHHPDYFQDPDTFNPERWADTKDVLRLEKCYIPFGKGTRACAGINLAWCELYVVIGTLFRRYPNLVGNHLEAEDVVYDDYFTSYHPLEARKFHVRGVTA